MMGIKNRSFGPLPPVTLEDLIPPDSFYRHLERTLDLGFVRDLVRDAYAEVGRPSIDPEKLTSESAAVGPVPMATPEAATPVAGEGTAP